MKQKGLDKETVPTKARIDKMTEVRYGFEMMVSSKIRHLRYVVFWGSSIIELFLQIITLKSSSCMNSGSLNPAQPAVVNNICCAGSGVFDISGQKSRNCKNRVHGNGGGQLYGIEEKFIAVH